MHEQKSSLWDYYNIKQKLQKNKKENKGKKCSIASAVQIGIQLTKKLRDLHKLGYLHLDIKPDNILIGKQESA